jgi:hypothetical protein
LIYEKNIEAMKYVIKYGNFVENNTLSLFFDKEIMQDWGEERIYNYLNRYKRYDNIGYFVINDFLSDNHEDLKESSISETRDFIKNISGKSFEEANKVIAERTKKIHKVIDKFLS